ncbi:MAG: methionine--tRNA ligase [Limnochordia bacterium]|nr:methionine--tRNA ligase [Limnochordia bacterium]MDD4517389.1 methionine--tRNA ligase [Limnochordia bacterium]
MSKDTYFITTPIYYPSDKLHIGHAYTTVIADALARYHRLLGKKVLFLTGSDDHGQKIEKVAEKRGITPKEYVDGIVPTFMRLWERLNISYDDFIRTTDERHKKVVQEVFMRVYNKGDIYKGYYEGWYCTPCEAFWLESKLVDHKCPDCGRPVELLKEEAYYFRISKYADRLLEHIEKNPEFIQPESRKNEMVQFIKSGLEDLCVSRTSFDWGIPVPINSDHVIYVWFDALTNYLTGSGYLQDEVTFKAFWPADLHLVGKEITRFHTIIWPIILMALDLELPKQVFGHGWLLMDSDKMSKSKGNVVDPNLLIDEFGADAIRYFLLREISFGADGNFSVEALIQRTNADLANDLGNLLHRSLTMIQKYFDGVIPTPGPENELDESLRKGAEAACQEVDRYLGQLQINAALGAIWSFIGRTNKYIDESEPWNVAKSQDTPRLARIMYNLAEALRMTAFLVWPFIPATGESILEQLGVKQEFQVANRQWGLLEPNTKTQPTGPLFPRIDIKEREAALEAKKSKQTEKDAGEEQVDELISIDEFQKVKLCVGHIVDAQSHPNADRLVVLKVDTGDEVRQIVAGIAKHYAPEDLKGKKVVIVANLKPTKLRGELSEGMVLAAVSEEELGLVTVDKDIPAGAVVR